MSSRIRTDLAIEAEPLFGAKALSSHAFPGLRCSEEVRGGFSVSTVEVLDERGEEAIAKPKGKYITIELGALLRREENAFAEACRLLAGELRSLMYFPVFSSVLVVGLGNRDITPDAVGPITVDNLMVTRHLRSALPDHFGSFRSVSALCSGVLGTTGIESSEIIAAVCKAVKPSAVIAVDALASRSTQRLCRTVQLSDTGIVPGSGVGNSRQALDEKTLGVPVIAVGVPTVVDAATLACDLISESGLDIDPNKLKIGKKLIVTPSDIDKSVGEVSKLIGYAINLALHEDITIEDIDMFLS
ncbi:MAG: GPR endopeptidase [Oscillospiraceae bacterium]|nr:GPR endopeptidase [Oscillospiraceae bacterium]